MEKKEIIKVLDNLDKFIVKGTVKKGRGRNKEYDEITILKMLVLLTLAKISYRGAKGFLEGNGEYIEYLGLKTIPSLSTSIGNVKKHRSEMWKNINDFCEINDQAN